MVVPTLQVFDTLTYIGITLQPKLCYSETMRVCDGVRIVAFPGTQDHLKLLCDQNGSIEDNKDTDSDIGDTESKRKHLCCWQALWDTLWSCKGAMPKGIRSAARHQHRCCRLGADEARPSSY